MTWCMRVRFLLVSASRICSRARVSVDIDIMFSMNLGTMLDWRGRVDGGEGCGRVKLVVE